NAQVKATQEANAIQREALANARADQAPYLQAGVSALGKLSDLAQTPLTYRPYEPTPALTPPAPLDPAAYAFHPPTVTDDPGYAFRVQQGQQALERSAAAKGMQLSGAQLKGTQRFAQDLASTEYNAAYGRAFSRNQ